MAIFRCKSCGGDLDVKDGVSVVECEYCGNKQTLPKVTDENLQALFNRASFLRQKCEFDKAEQVYEKILEENDREAEAYWGVILCKFGIEYVEDPASGKRIPTCHRASYDSIVADDYYKQAIKYADALQRPVYEADAKTIDEIQKGIVAISKKEEPYDVFICYKETDASGQRTQDSVIANEIYYQLKQEGFKVFYAAITLEDKLGSAYEPVIFAALNSAKVMLAIGTKPEYFQAVWVKNEWSRFLKLMKKDHSKSLFPCYRDMDAYDLPEEFAHLQGLDMSKIGFVNDLVRGIKKLIVKEAPKAATAAPAAANTAAAPLLKRVFMFLEDGDFEGADEQCEKVLDLEPENAMAYVGKLMAELQVRKQANLANLKTTFEGNPHYKRAYRFADDELKKTLEGYNAAIRKRDADARKEDIYDEAIRMINSQGDVPEILSEAAKKFASIAGYRDSAERAKECAEQAKALAYQYGLDTMKKATMRAEFEEAADWFHDVLGYKDADRLLAECKELAKKADYDTALDIMQNNRDNAANLTAAAREFEKLGDYKDARAKAIECHDLAKVAAYNGAVHSMQALKEMASVSDSIFNLWDAGKNTEADALFEKAEGAPGLLRTLARTFESMGAYRDAKKYKDECYALAKAIEKEVKYITAIETEDYNKEEKLNQAIAIYTELGDYRDCPTLLQKAQKRISELRAASQKAYKAEQKRKKRKKILIIAAVLFIPVISVLISLYDSLILSGQKYDEAIEQLAAGQYDEAYSTLSELYAEGNEEAGEALLKNATERILALVNNGDYEAAEELLTTLDRFINLDNDSRREKIYYQVGVNQMEAGKNDVAYVCFTNTNDYSDSATRIATLRQSAIDEAAELAEKGYYTDAYDLLVAFGVNEETFPDGATAFDVLEAIKNGNYKRAVELGLTEIIIPSGVTEITDRMFQNCKQLKKVVIPTTVKKIGAYAFDGCTSLTTISVPTGVTEMGDGAFKDCASLQAFIIPTGMTSVPNHLLRGCSSLTSLSISASVTEIGEYAFADCSSLQKVTIPQKVTTINQYAFANCTGLTDVTVPSDVTYLGNHVFNGCSAIESLTLPFVGQKADGTGYTRLAFLFDGTYADGNDIPSSLTTVTVTGSTAIGNYAFSGSASLTSVTLPDTITSIGIRAFESCPKLTSVDIPDEVTSIGEYAFYNCTGLTSIEIPDNVTTIGQYAFANCTKFTSVTVPSSVTSIGNHVFNGCNAIVSVTVPFIGQLADGTGDEQFAWIFAGSYGDGDDVPESLTTITVTGGDKVGYAAFSSIDTLTSLTLPETMTAIGAQAFEYCYGLTSLDIPDAVTTIGEYAFRNCTGMEGITIPTNVISIGRYAFTGCTQFTSVTLPNLLTEIGDHAFSGCTALETMSVPFIGQKSDGTGNTRFAWLFGGSSATVSSVPATLTSVTVRGGDIGDYAFYTLSNLTEIKLPAATKIGAHSFEGCSGIETLVIPEGVTTIGNNAFYGCSNLTLSTVPANVTTIGSSAFYGCSAITSFTVPSGVTSIGRQAFYQCYALQTLTVPFVGTLADGTDSVVLDTIIDAENSSGAYALSKVIVTGGTSIGASAFKNCAGLTSVVLPETVTSIGASAFYGCTSLSTISLPAAVRSIGESAFQGCYNLSTVGMPKELTQIGSYAFKYCYNLTSITLNSKVSSIGSGAFTDCFKLLEIRDYAPVIVEAGDITNNGGLGAYAKFVITDSTADSNLHAQGSFLFYTDPDDSNIYLLAYTGVSTEITLPTSYRGVNNDEALAYHLAPYAFYKNLRIIDVDTSAAQTIGANAFEGCTALTKVSISADEIGSAAFRGCSSLVELTLCAGSSAVINEYAFASCSKLESVYIPNSVKTIARYAFSGTKLSAVIFEEPTGWAYNSSLTTTSGTAIAPASLSNAATAASYLKSTYVSNYWHCNANS